MNIWNFSSGGADGAGLPFAPVILLGIVVQLLALYKPSVLLGLIPQPIIGRFLVVRLQIRKALINCRLIICELGMARCKTVIICLQRGYLTGHEPNLRSNRVLCRACVNHPVEVINIFLECFHKVRVATKPNDKLTHSPST